MTPEAGSDPGPLPERLAVGLAKVALAARHRHRELAAAHGLSATQAQLLVLLRGERAGVRLSTLAERLRVTLPTVSESVAALEAKGLVERRPDPEDGRAARIRLTRRGQRTADRVATWTDELVGVVELLDGERQQQLLDILVRIIKGLQEQGRIPIARMCVSCVYFRPYAHSDPARPHHCAFVDAPFGAGELRVECEDFAAAPEEVAARTWARYTAAG